MFYKPLLTEILNRIVAYTNFGDNTAPKAKDNFHNRKTKAYAGHSSTSQITHFPGGGRCPFAMRQSWRTNQIAWIINVTEFVYVNPDWLPD